jgi:hypothetical protein
MPLNIPSTVNVTVGTVELQENAQTVHYQQFVLTSPDGTPLGNTSNLIPVSVAVSGNYVSNFNADATVFPVGGVYYEESLANSLTELQNNELSVNRLTVRGGVKTAGDGRVNELIGSSSSGYDDIVVVSGTYDATSLGVLNANGEFFQLTNTSARHFYIPMIRSGWRTLSFSFIAPVSGIVSVYTDLGSKTRDILAGSFSTNAAVRYGVVAATITTSGSLIGIPALSYPVNGFIITFEPADTDAGTYELHITRGA